MKSPCARFARIVSGSLLLLALAARLSAATIYDNRQDFLTAHPGLSVISFEGLAPPTDSAILPQPQQGVTFEGGRNFSSLNPNLVSVAPASTFATGSAVGFVNSTTGYAMRITFDRVYTAVGVQVRSGNGGGARSATVRAVYNGATVAQRNLTTAADFSTFIGFSETTGIDHLEILTDEQQGDFVLIDDLRFGQAIEDTTDVPVRFEWRNVGNAGNLPDNTGFGSVPYNFRIAKYPVTNAEYAEFLNAKAAADPLGLYNIQQVTAGRTGIVRSGNSGSYHYVPAKYMANKPTVYVSFYDAVRYINWVHNGRGNASMETGAYDMTVTDPTRLPGAKVFLPTEDEWYKAAYYDPTPGAGGGDNYWLYPTRSNSAPTKATTFGNGVISNPGSNVANYGNGASWNGLLGHYTQVGSAGPLSESYYGTADQGGNCYEWNEVIWVISQVPRRGLRGGFYATPVDSLAATNRDANTPDAETPAWGFRLAAPAPLVDIAIEGPAALLEDAAGGIAVHVRRSGDTDFPVTVNLAVAGTALAGSDYSLGGSSSTAVTIPQGAAEAVLTITPTADNLDEADESVVVSLLAGETYNLGTTRSVTASILDDDFTPVAQADPGYEVVEDSSLSVPAAGGVLANDTDEDDGNGPAHLTAELVSGVSHGLLALAADGSFVYTPAANYHGPDSFSYRASDGTNLSAPATVSIQVTTLVDLRLSSASDVAVVGAPGQVKHTLTLQNAGPSDATKAAIDLSLVFPSGVVPGAAVVSAGAVAGSRWTVDLVEGGSATLSVTYAVSAAAPGGIGSIVTAATVAGVDQPRTALGDDATTVASSIVSPASLGVTRIDPEPKLNRQSGLLVQKITVTNNNPLPLAAFRLLIGNLPEGGEVYNRHGVTAGGIAYLDSAGVLAPGASVTLTVEFYRADRRTEISAAYSVASVQVVAPEEPPVAAAGGAPTRILRLENGDMMIEFDSTVGHSYAVEYSADMQTWHRALPAITAVANRTQWTDAGPPKTASHPSTVPARYYRVVPLEAGS